MHNESSGGGTPAEATVLDYSSGNLQNRSGESLREWYRVVKGPRGPGHFRSAHHRLSDPNKCPCAHETTAHDRWRIHAVFAPSSPPALPAPRVTTSAPYPRPDPRRTRYFRTMGIPAESRASAQT
jgi:hypothetical protein